MAAALVALLAWRVTVTSGPLPVLALVGTSAVVLLVWRQVHRWSVTRFVVWRVRGVWRTATVYRYLWQPAMVTTALAVRVEGTEYLPKAVSVRSTGSVDVVRVRMLPGQTISDWASNVPRLAPTFGALDCRVPLGAVAAARPGAVVPGLPPTHAAGGPVRPGGPARPERAVTAAGDKALIFTGAKGGAPRRSNFRTGTRWDETCMALGFPGLHFHDLRHTGNTLAAQTGTSLRDLMTRMGHDSPRAALIYQHASSGADRAIADALDLLIAATQEPTDNSGAEHDQGDDGTGQIDDLVG